MEIVEDIVFNNVKLYGTKSFMENIKRVWNLKYSGTAIYGVNVNLNPLPSNLDGCMNDAIFLLQEELTNRLHCALKVMDIIEKYYSSKSHYGIHWENEQKTIEIIETGKRIREDILILTNRLYKSKNEWMKE